MAWPRCGDTVRESALVTNRKFFEFDHWINIFIVSFVFWLSSVSVLFFLDERWLREVISGVRGQHDQQVVRLLRIVLQWKSGHSSFWTFGSTLWLLILLFGTHQCILDRKEVKQFLRDLWLLEKEGVSCCCVLLCHWFLLGRCYFKI